MTTQTNEHLTKLLEARSRLLAERRELAATLAGSQRGKTESQREKFIAVQKTIEAIDAALADEQKIATASRTPTGGVWAGPVSRGPDFDNRG